MAGRPYDIVVLGVGFYGQRVLKELVALSAGRYRLAAAGRRPGAVADAVAALGASSPDALAGPDHGVAVLSPCDAYDSMAMAGLAESTRVVVACVPDCRAAGDAMVGACARAGTHYLDLSLDTDLHAKWAGIHGAAAEDNGAVILPCCGYDHVVADFGALEAGRLFPPPTALASVAAYMRVEPGPAGLVLRESTFERLVAGMGSPTERLDPEAAVRAGRRPAPGDYLAPPDSDSGRALEFSAAVEAWTLPGPASEADTIGLTQAQLLRVDPGRRPARYSARVAMPSLPAAAVAAAGMGLLAAARLPLARRLLLAAGPAPLRTLGVLTWDPEVYEESVRQLRVRRTLVALGYSGLPPGAPAAGAPPLPPPDLEAVLEISASPYAVTPAALALAAVTLLEERAAVGAAGFTSPAAALHRTRYWRRLTERCGIEIRRLPHGAT